MFYYTASQEPKLEVSIVENYTEEDLERIFLFIDALMESPQMTVIFKVHPATIEQFKKSIQDRFYPPMYLYNIQEKIA